MIHKQLLSSVTLRMALLGLGISLLNISPLLVVTFLMTPGLEFTFRGFAIGAFDPKKTFLPLHS